MFCEKCGSQLAENALFCENCGCKVENSTFQIDSNQMDTFNNVSSQIRKIPMNSNNRKFSRKQCIILGSIAVIGLISVVFLLNRKTRINLNDYLGVEFDGYDTVGEAKITFDDRKFKDKYSKLISKGNKSDKSQKSILTDDVDAFLKEYIDGELDREANLSNGDEVVFTWDCYDGKVLDKYNIKLVHPEATFKVSGLKEEKTLDPFENVEIVYSGLAPNVIVEIINKSSNEYLSKMHYECDSNNHLSNGDKIILKVSNSWGQSINLDEYIDKGYLIKPVEKEYTVDGLGSYAMKLSGVSDDVIKSMKKQTEDHIASSVAKNWSNNAKLIDKTYAGNYFLVAKNSESANTVNRFIMVYKIDATIENEEHGIKDDVSYYYYVSFDNIVVTPDGKVSVNLEKYDYPRNSFTKRYEYKSSYGSKLSESYYFTGYENLDSLFNETVTKNIEKYSYEEDMDSEESSNASDGKTILSEKEIEPLITCFLELECLPNQNWNDTYIVDDNWYYCAVENFTSVDDIRKYAEQYMTSDMIKIFEEETRTLDEDVYEKKNGKIYYIENLCSTYLDSKDVKDITEIGEGKYSFVIPNTGLGEIVDEYYFEVEYDQQKGNYVISDYEDRWL